jgi:hypothetical protein
MRKHPLSLAVLFACSATAQANASMGYALEVFDLAYWYLYVAVTTVLEAWLIGRYFELSWLKSLLASAIANAVTGFCCAGSGALAPFLHENFVGTETDPQPFLNALALLTVFALPSALLESIAWHFWIKGKEKSLVGGTIVAHLIGIPVALTILLVPNEPYKHVWTESPNAARLSLLGAVEDFLAEHKRIPAAKSIPELVDEVMPPGPKRERTLAGLIIYRHTRFKSERVGFIYSVEPSLPGKKFKATGRNEWRKYLLPDARRQFLSSMWINLSTGEATLSKEEPKVIDIE